MKRHTEIRAIEDHYAKHGTITESKKTAVLHTADLSIKELLFITKNYPTYKARCRTKIDKETDPDVKNTLTEKLNTLTIQLDEARQRLTDAF